MTFDDLDDGVKARVEQLAFDAGCNWIEEFREERIRDPEPEECDEEAQAVAVKLLGSVERLLQRRGVHTTPELAGSIQAAVRRMFVDALEM